LPDQQYEETVMLNSTQFAAGYSDAKSHAAAAGRPPKADRRIEICCFGRFSMRRQADATPAFVPVKSRPVALLQVLITAGPVGIQRREAEIKLWPRAQVEISDTALDTTVYRLRKVLGNQHAVTVESSSLRLNERIVSIDAWRFEAEVEELNLALTSPLSVTEISAIASRCKQLFDLYQGPFFAQDKSSPWVARMRDLFHAKFVRSVKHTGCYWQSTRQWDRAITLYERALEIDNLAEEIHRELMRCHLAKREFSDVVRVFRRCRELLSLVMGVPPCEETEMIYRQALAGQVRL
jgi:LuxR family transcriptional regulator, maltose regulon positive regulatory protein